MCKSWKLDLFLCTVPKSRGDIRMMMRRYIWGPIRESATIVTSSTSQSRKWWFESHVTATVCPLRETGTGSSELQAMKWAGVGHRGRTSLLLHRQWMAGSMTRRDEAAVQTAPLRHADWKGHGRSVQRSYCHWLSPRTGLAEYIDSRLGCTLTLRSSSVYRVVQCWSVTARVLGKWNVRVERLVMKLKDPQRHAGVTAVLPQGEPDEKPIGDPMVT